MDSDVLRLWTTLEDKSDSSESEDALEDQLADDAIEPQITSSKRKSLVRSSQVVPRAPATPAPSSLWQSPQAGKTASNADPVVRNLKRPATLQDTNASTPSSAKKLTTSTIKRAPLDALPSETQARNSPAVSNLADVLSSAFTQNAQEPYPSPRTLARTLPEQTKRHKNNFLAPKTSLAANTRLIVGARRPLHLWQADGAPRSRRTERTRDGFKIQHKIDEFLDVQYAPITLGTGQSSQSPTDETPSPATPMTDVVDTARETRSNQIIAFNLRHVFASHAAKKQESPPTPKPPPYAVNPQSYTAMYLERVREWFGDHALGEDITEEETVARDLTGRLEHIIMPSPQIPRQHSLTDVLTNDWEDRTSTSIDPDDTEASELNATSPSNTTGSAIGAPAGSQQSNDLEVSVSPIVGLERGHVEGSTSRESTDTWNLLNATILLQRLVKGKTKLADEDVRHVRTILESLSSDSRTIYSKALEDGTPEDRTCFLQAVYRISSQVSSTTTTDLPGLSQADGRAIKRSAWAVARKFNAASAENKV
ncbi:hypothetical protein V5O48_004427 [Marasmius crinis-equi]|uniref:Uncharacterized protein n=1 Tax=Marasmius crinis-equi TaxID=585013 RepID=A0ABR3FQ38_9AGAR